MYLLNFALFLLRGAFGPSEKFSSDDFKILCLFTNEQVLVVPASYFIRQEPTTPTVAEGLCV